MDMDTVLTLKCNKVYHRGSCRTSSAALPMDAMDSETTLVQRKTGNIRVRQIYWRLLNQQTTLDSGNPWTWKLSEGGRVLRKVSHRLALFSVFPGWLLTAMAGRYSTGARERPLFWASKAIFTYNLCIKKALNITLIYLNRGTTVVKKTAGCEEMFCHLRLAMQN